MTKKLDFKPFVAQDGPGEKKVTCPECDGKGFTRKLDNSGGFSQGVGMKITCPECDGIGKVAASSLK